MVENCSTPALPPQETRGHRELVDGLEVPASSGSRQSADGDEQQPLMSARYAGARGIGDWHSTRRRTERSWVHMARHVLDVITPSSDSNDVLAATCNVLDVVFNRAWTTYGQTD